MGLGGQQVALVAIALPMSQYQVMRKVTGVARPGYKMVDFSPLDSSPAVQALSLLSIGEGGDHAE
jgi:hypothetical protein